MGVFSPTNSVPAAFPDPLLNSTSIRAGSSPYSARFEAFSSITRSISSCSIAEVTDDTSDSAALAATGDTTCHAPPTFFRLVTSPDSDLTRSSSMSAALTEANAFSFVDSLLSGCGLTK